MPQSLAIFFALLAALAVGIIIGIIIGIIWVHVRMTKDPFDVEDQFPVPSDDPWAVQGKIMEISDQELPTGPTLTKTGLLYGALVLEEVGETMAAQASILAIITAEFAPDSPIAPMHATVSEAERALLEVHRLLDSAGKVLSYHAKAIRDELTKVEALHCPLRDDEVAELFDGTIDITVVNCGLALAFGLPGADGYAECANSNLSKRNPVTGRIDKDAGGKWIKGPNYTKPDLLAVLQHARRRREECERMTYADPLTMGITAAA